MSPFAFFSSAFVLALVTLAIAAVLMNAPLWAVIVTPLALLLVGFLVVTRRPVEHPAASASRQQG